MAWAVEKHCLEIKCNNNAIYEFLTLQWNLDEVEKLYRGYLSVVCTFFWNHETNGQNYPVKIL